MRSQLRVASLPLLGLLVLGSILPACNVKNTTPDNIETNPVPQLTSLSPSTAVAGGTGFMLTVRGSGFADPSFVAWNGIIRTTARSSSTQLTATIPASDIAVPGTAQVTVVNPPPGGGTSNALAFTIGPLPAGVQARVGVGNSGAQADGLSTRTAVSADGRYVAFTSFASNLVAGDTNGVADVFLRDTCVNGPPVCTSVTTRVSVSSTNAQGDGPSDTPSISADGRFIAFLSGAANLVAGDTNAEIDIFVRDTCINAPGACAASTVRVSVSSSGAQADGMSQFPAISSTGRFVAFQSFATTLVPGDTNSAQDVFVRDTCFGATGCTASTSLVSVSTAGLQGDNDSAAARITPDGRYVAFESRATNLVPGDTNGVFDVFLRDTCVGAPAGCLPATARVSVTSSGAEANDASGGIPALSDNGRFVSFSSLATNLVPGDTNSASDDFLRDTCNGAPAGCVPSTIRVSVSSSGGQGDSGSDPASISADGRFVAFRSGASNLVSGDTNGVPDVFVRDTCLGVTSGCTPATVRVSVSSSGAQGDAQSGFVSVSLSADGRWVAFSSSASNLVAGDTNGLDDVFLARAGF